MDLERARASAETGDTDDDALPGEPDPHRPRRRANRTEVLIIKHASDSPEIASHAGQTVMVVSSRSPVGRVEKVKPARRER